MHAGIPPPGKADPPVQCMLGDTVNKRAVCILLECNLVYLFTLSYQYVSSSCHYSFFFNFFLRAQKPLISTVFIAVANPRFFRPGAVVVATNFTCEGISLFWKV